MEPSQSLTMSDLKIFQLCSFVAEDADYLKALDQCLREIPATITTAEVAKAHSSEEDQTEQQESDVGTTPLHRLCESIEPDASEEKVELAREMMVKLFEYGANWMILDEQDETPGDIALRRGISKELYDVIVSAGVRSEVFLRKMTEETPSSGEALDPATEQHAYLAAPLEYNDSALVTTSHQDGVMMDWEAPIMEKSAELITTGDKVVLNVGFGMGIIDNYIQQQGVHKHYISEAHPDVLAKLKKDGWYDKENVVILEGRWQDTLPKILEQQVYFDGIYYDTFSEHYQDLVDFFDTVVGLLQPEGVFSFFNGLGADRQVCYDVYKQVVEFDLSDYGLSVEYLPVPVKTIQEDENGGTWNGIRHKYWTLKEYYLPIIRFQGV